jgi:hypothetical protein
MDIVYLLKESKENEELRYSLRSLKNMPHDKVFFVGGMPDFVNLDKVFHIPTLQDANRYKNTATGMLTACMCSKISDDFILMNDDFFIMTPIKDVKKEFNLHRGLLDDMILYYSNEFPFKDEYLSGLRETRELLRRLKIHGPLSYELHIPMVINKRDMVETFLIPGFMDMKAPMFRSLYGNLHLKDSQYTHDVKMDALHLELPDNPTFLSTSDSYFKTIKVFMNAIFPDKSEYEL